MSSYDIRLHKDTLPRFLLFVTDDLPIDSIEGRFATSTEVRGEKRLVLEGLGVGQGCDLTFIVVVWALATLERTLVI